MTPTTVARRHGAWTVVDVMGELDVYTAPRLREELIERITAGHRHLIVDLDRVTFIDSTGLGVLIGALKRIRAYDGELRLVATTDQVLRPLRVTGLHRVFPPYDCVENAAVEEPLAPPYPS